MRAAPRNALTDIAGLTLGHATDDRLRSGVTVVVCAEPFPAAVDVRGGGPGTRETDALAPEALFGRASALVLSGGSMFGLAAADGVAAALTAEGRGLRIAPGAPPVAIVPSAILYDLGNGGDKAWGDAPPYRELGAAAYRAAGAEVAIGAVGAGRGAVAGRVKGGLGTASAALESGETVAALVAVNPVGSVLTPCGRAFWAWPWEIGGEFGGGRPDLAHPSSDGWAQSKPLPQTALAPASNTTIGVLATDAALDRADLKRVAAMAQDGFARAIRPAHTPFDGDTLFALATGSGPASRDPAAIARLGAAAADCVARAIARGVWSAIADPNGPPAARDLLASP
ncbi:MAG: P1 family peptidase [Pseudomonadota bacterium]